MKKRCHGGPLDGREVEVQDDPRIHRVILPGPGMRAGLGHDGLPTVFFEMAEYRVDGDRLVYAGAVQPEPDAPTVVNGA